MLQGDGCGAYAPGPMNKPMLFGAACALSLCGATLDVARADDARGPETPTNEDARTPFVAQPEEGAIVAGDFTFRPELDVFLRGELRIDGARGAEAPVLHPRIVAPPGADSVEAFARARIGLGMTYGPLRAKVSLETTGALGDTASFDLRPREAYIDLSTEDRDVFFRIGRQVVVLGDGRLVGDTPLGPTGRSLDAARLGIRAGDFDFQALAAVLELPTDASIDGSLLPGAQLYALEATWHLLPFLKPELLLLARTSRNPPRTDLTPSDTFVVAPRVFGDHRGFSYSVVGAIQAGRVAIEGDVLDQLAGAVAGRVQWKTALPWSFTFGVDAAYATGDTAPVAGETIATFDPILPDSHVLGETALMAWSNQLTFGGDVAFYPVEPLGIEVGYKYVGLAESGGAMMSGDLRLVGRSAGNTSHAFGHLAELGVGVTPWRFVRFSAEYALIPLMDGGKSILQTEDDLAHFGMLDARLVLP